MRVWPCAIRSTQMQLRKSATRSTTWRQRRPFRKTPWTKSAGGPSPRLEKAMSPKEVRTNDAVSAIVWSAFRGVSDLGPGGLRRVQKSYTNRLTVCKGGWMNPRLEKGIETRRRIIEAARRSFAEVGYEATYVEALLS